MGNSGGVHWSSAGWKLMVASSSVNSWVPSTRAVGDQGSCRLHRSKMPHGAGEGGQAVMLLSREATSEANQGKSANRESTVDVL